MSDPSTTAIEIAEWGAVRPALIAAVRAAADGYPFNPERGTRLLVFIGAMERPRAMRIEDADAIESVGREVFRRVRGFVSADGNLRQSLTVVFVLDDAAAMGDPQRPLDSTIAGSVLSFARALALECRRADGHVSTIMTATIDREGEHPDRAVAKRIVTTADEGVETTGSEDFVGQAVQLGRIRP